MPTTTQNRKAALASDYTPLYAVAGLADIAYSAVRDRVAATIDDLRTRQTKINTQLTARADQARTQVEGLPEQLKHLPEQLRSLPDVAKAQLSELSKQANATYGDLAGRGKGAVDKTVAGAKDAQTRAESLFAKPATDEPAADEVKADEVKAEEVKAEEAKPAAKTTPRKTTARTARTTKSTTKKA